MKLYTILSFFSVFVTASLLPESSTLHSMTVAPNYVFWNYSDYDLHRYFDNIELVKERLRQPFAEAFVSSSIPTLMPHIKITIARLIQRLSSDAIIEILAEGNPSMIRFFLGKLFNNFERFESLTLPADVPNLHLIPIEELEYRNLARIPLPTLVKVALARIERGLLKNRWIFFNSLPSAFWLDSKIRHNVTVVNFFAPLCLPNLENYALINGHELAVTEVTMEFSEIFKNPFSSYFDAFFGKSIVADLLHKYQNSDDVNARLRYISDLKLINFHIQSILHTIYVTNHFNMPVIIRIAETFFSIKSWTAELLSNFPGDVNLKELLDSCATCYSVVLYRHLLEVESPHSLFLQKYFFGTHYSLGELADLKRLLGLPAEKFSFKDIADDRKNFYFVPIFMLVSSGVRLGSDMQEYIEMVAESIAKNEIDVTQLNIEPGIVRNFRHIFDICPHHVKPIILQMFSVDGIFVFKNIYSRLSAIIGDTSPRLNFNLIVRPFFLNSFQATNERCILNEPGDFEHLRLIVSSLAYDVLDRYSLPHHPPSFSIPNSVALPSYQYLDLSSLKRKNSSHQDVIKILLKNDIIAIEEDWETYEHIEFAYIAFHKWSTSNLFSEPQSDQSQHSNFIRSSFNLYPPLQASSFVFPPLNRRQTVESMANEVLLSRNFQFGALKDMQIPQEIGFIEELLDGFARCIQNPVADWQIFFSNTIDLGGVGPIVDTLHAFGKVIALPQLRTFISTDSNSGYVPAPFLCPRVMAFTAVWIAACWKYNVTLPWQFNDMFLRFLLYDWPNSSDQAAEAFVEEIYAPVFKFISETYDYMHQESSFDPFLPLTFRPHRMFSIPAPHSAGASPFIFELRALEMNAILSKSPSQRVKLLMLGKERYMRLVKTRLTQNLYEGRLEFQRHFRLFFSSEFSSNFTHSLFSTFFRSEPINLDELIANIKIPEGFVRNDLQSAETELISYRDLLVSTIRSFDCNQLKRFLWFVIGSSNPPLGGFRQSPIKFSVSEDAKLARSYVCFRKVIWYVQKDSAAESLKNLLIAVNFSSGFLESE